MNILYLCADPGIPVRGHKGSAIHIRALIDAFRNLGHTVSLVAPKSEGGEGAPIHARLVEVERGEKPATFSAEAHERAAVAMADEIFRAGKNLAGEEKFDFIYERYSLWSDAGARLAMETGLPLAVEVNSPLRREAARYRSLLDVGLARQIEADIASAADLLTVVSEPLKKYLVEQGADAEKIHVIPNAVDERLFHPAASGNALRSELGLENKFVIGFVGTVRPWHDLDTLIEALDVLKNAEAPPILSNGDRGGYHLLLVGEVPEIVRQAIASRRLEKMTTVIAPVAHSAVPSFLASMDVAVSPHPNMADFYFSPLKLFEYLACGIATVAADVAPIAQVITEGENGLLYRPGDAEGLASQIARLAVDPVLREALGSKAAARIHHGHTWKDNARQVIDLIKPHCLPGNRQSELDVASGADDQLLPLLDLATRRDLAGELFLRYLEPDAGDEFASVTDMEILKYRPGHRCVLAYEMSPRNPDGDPQKIIGKIFRDERGKEQFRIQRDLWAGGFQEDSADQITVARPLAYIREMQMFVQERVQGATLDAYLDAEGFEEKTRSSAAALAKLHACPVRPSQAYILKAELGNLDRWGAELSALRPELAAKFASLLDQLKAFAGRLPSVDLAPVHRDFYYGQILFSDPRVTIIDFDLLAMGDPVIDVANFAAHIQFLAIQYLSDPNGLDRVADAFVAEYLSRRPLEGFRARFQFYEAATFFRLMYVAHVRPHFNHFFDALLKKCEAKIQPAAETLVLT